MAMLTKLWYIGVNIKDMIEIYVLFNPFFVNR